MYPSFTEIGQNLGSY